MKRPWKMWALCGVLALGGLYWLWSNGYSNVLGYAMILICPLMHLLVHRGHSHGDEGDKPGRDGTKPSCH